MTKFDLYKSGFDYILKHKDITIYKRRFNTEIEAYDFFVNFITSFPSSTLSLEFEMLEDRT